MLDTKSEAVRRELFKIYHEITDPRNDGFVQWEYKKSLIDVKYMLDTMLSETSNFGSFEENYIKNKEQEKLIRVLIK